jgi:hypothetical protein
MTHDQKIIEIIRVAYPNCAPKTGEKELTPKYLRELARYIEELEDYASSSLDGLTPGEAING